MSSFHCVLLRAADELVTDHRVSDDTWAALAERYDDQQMIELTLLVGNYVMVVDAQLGRSRTRARASPASRKEIVSTIASRRSST